MTKATHWYWILAMALVAITGSSRASHAQELQVYSRSIPAHCTYVYAVETDFKMRWDAPAAARHARQAVLEYALLSAYPEVPSSGQKQMSFSKGQDGWETGFTELTMSTNPKFLSRELLAQIHVTLRDGSTMTFPSETSHYWVDFGRQMNERCYPHGRPLTPYYPREVRIIE